MEGYYFSERVRQALQNARVEATKLQQESVGTEHILLALLDVPDSVAVAVLPTLGVDGVDIRKRILQTVKRGNARDTGTRELPYTSRAKKVLELAMLEARELGHNHIGSGHLLLGLIREERGIAAQLLTNGGLTLDAARQEVLRHPSATGRSSGPTVALDSAVRLPTPATARPSLERLVKTLVFWLILLLVPILLIQFNGK